MASRVFDEIKFCEHFYRRPPKEYSCQVWSKLAPQFKRRRFFFKKTSSCLYSAIPHSQEACFLKDQNFATIFEKGHQGNISVNLFQNLSSSFREKKSEFLHVCIVQLAPIHQSQTLSLPVS